MAAFKSAYLIHGDDHGRIRERRAALRALAERESGSGGVECLEGDAATPEAVAAALSAMTFAIGRRFIVVDGAERWKDPDVEAHVAPALEALAPDTTIAFFAREEGRWKVPPALVAAVERAGGSVAAERTLKARELPRWLQGEAARLGVQLDREGAQALVAIVGERQQRLLRELEKLSLEHGPGARIGLDEVEAAAAHSSERQVWGLVDALVAGDGAAATRAFLELQAQGESVARLVGLLARRVRDVLQIALRLEAGESAAQVKQSLKMSPYAADRRVAEARRSDVDRLSRALETLADLELATHGASELADATEAIRAIARIAA
ncbi:MAG TPA: DNA polymerase III subunit delta [Solirubrobacteraceae bacterium]|jgi:DNA polymerase III subunit delta|nr:DNA polymerase III subunit delta [Solirubrobacteraceae bacterium]